MNVMHTLFEASNNIVPTTKGFCFQYLYSRALNFAKTLQGFGEYGIIDWQIFPPVSIIKALYL